MVSRAYHTRHGNNRRHARCSESLKRIQIRFPPIFSCKFQLKRQKSFLAQFMEAITHIKQPTDNNARTEISPTAERLINSENRVYPKIINQSSREISTDEASLLQKGLRHQQTRKNYETIFKNSVEFGR